MEPSFRNRLIAGQASILLVLAAAVTTAILALRSTEAELEQAAGGHARLAVLDQLRAEARELARSARRYLLTRNPQERQRAGEVEAGMHRDRERLRDDPRGATAPKLERELDAYVTAVRRAMEAEPGEPASALARFEDDLARARGAIGAVFDEIVARERARLRASEASRRLARGARWALVIAGALGVVLALGVALGVTRLLARQRERTRRAEIEIERAAAVRNELLAASDELRGPLEAIAARCAELRAKPRDEAERGALEAIAASAGRVTHLLGELLDVTAIQTGRSSLRRQSCEAASLVERALARQRGAALERGIRLRSEAQPAVAVWADPERVGHALETMLRAAIAGARVGAEIVVGAAPSSEGVRFAITDASPDPPGPLARYEPVAAVAPADELELQLCRRVIEAHGGRVGIEAHGGRVGVEAALARRTYWFTLPVEPTLLR